MSDIGKKIKELLENKKLISKEILEQYFDYTKQKINSILFDYILKNNFEIYKVHDYNFKTLIKNDIDTADYKGKILSFYKVDTKFTKKYKVEIIDIMNNFSDNIFKTAFDHFLFKSLLRNNILGIEFLFNYKYSIECLTFMRQVSDLIYFDFSYLNSTINIIYNYFQNIFRYSRRMMAYMFVDNMFRNEFFKNVEKTQFYSRLTVIENEHDFSNKFLKNFEMQFNSWLTNDENVADSSDEFLKIIYKNGTEQKELIAYNKKSGINSGLILKTEKNKYYFKTFHNKFIKTTSIDSIHLNSRFTSNPTFTLTKQENQIILNIFEPLEYFILEQLDYCQKVEIIINPYVNQGLYIVTKDIEEIGNKFIIFKDIDNKIKQNILNEKDLKNNKNLVISLNELYIVSNILDIKDLNFGNFGFIEDEKSIKDSKYNNLKIIDFYPSKNNIGKNNCYNNLISRHYFTKNKEKQNIIEKIILYNDDENNNKNEMLVLAFQKFKDKLKGRNFKDILEKCLTKLINILELERGNNSDEIMLMCPNESRKRKNYEFLGYQNKDPDKNYFYPKIKSELESYIQNVNNNFNELEKKLIK